MNVCPSLSINLSSLQVMYIRRLLKEKFVTDMDGHIHGQTVDMNPVAVVSRRAWNAVDPRERTEMKSPAQTVIVHHTALRYCAHPRDSVSQLAHMQRMHMQERGFDDIGYKCLNMARQLWLNVLDKVGQWNSENRNECAIRKFKSEMGERKERAENMTRR